MKTTLIAILSSLLAISAFAETAREAMDAAYEWVEQESFRRESRAAQSRQDAALEDLQWELAEQRRQALANARIREENARRMEAQRQQQIAALRRIEQQQRDLAWQVELRRMRCK